MGTCACSRTISAWPPGSKSSTPAPSLPSPSPTTRRCPRRRRPARASCAVPTLWLAPATRWSSRVRRPCLTSSPPRGGGARSLSRGRTEQCIAWPPTRTSPASPRRATRACCSCGTTTKSGCCSSACSTPSTASVLPSPLTASCSWSASPTGWSRCSPPPLCRRWRHSPRLAGACSTWLSRPMASGLRSLPPTAQWPSTGTPPAPRTPPFGSGSMWVDTRLTRRVWSRSPSPPASGPRLGCCRAARTGSWSSTT
mmetsp:Transcript_30040/g.96913  ORF Transcript_30040/g.96913 Transcript_30040/m.96913 type:complete len:254 (-) Transcript_30040:1749-2510(-)